MFKRIWLDQTSMTTTLRLLDKSVATMVAMVVTVMVAMAMAAMAMVATAMAVGAMVVWAQTHWATQELASCNKLRNEFVF